MKKENKISSYSAKILVETKCVDISLKKKFKLTSGRESPIYCDCRRIISFPKQRDQLINFAIKKIQSECSLEKINNIAGGESAGIPFASFISQKTNHPLSYIRKEKKKFGKNSQIEGIIKPKENVLLVEDLMTDGGSKINFIKAILKTGANISAIFVIFNYGINLDYFIINKKKIKIIYLATWKDVIEEYVKKKSLTKKDRELIQEFLYSIGVKNLKSYP